MPARSLSLKWRDARLDLRRRLAMRFVSDRDYVSRLYDAKLGCRPNLDRPRGFNEKILVKMLSDRRPLLTLFADKLRVRDFVREASPRLRLPTLYWWSNRAVEIPFDTLPNEFVLKANHGSGWVRIVEDKNSVRPRELRAQGKRWLASDFTIVGREWSYKNVRRALYAEQLLHHEARIPPDYKLFVFNGRVRLIQVDRDRFKRHTQVLYDELWNLIEGTVAAAQGGPAERPASLAAMIEAAEALSCGVDFVRVDLYEIDGKPYFGELTSSPNKGLSPFRPASLDLLLGSFLQLDDYSTQNRLCYDPDAFRERGTLV